MGVPDSLRSLRVMIAMALRCPLLPFRQTHKMVILGQLQTYTGVFWYKGDTGCR